MSGPEDGTTPSERTVEVAGHEVLVQAPEAKGWVRSPGDVIVLLFGSALLTVSYIGALWASIEAFGGGLPIAGIAVVFLAGASLASAATMPGGIGAVEVALIAGLIALGLASAVAVPAVFL